MKLPKDRKMFPKLLLQFKAQETRISDCGLFAKKVFKSPYETEEGSVYSLKLKQI